MNGILFKPDMHQAIREDRKTVTRRLSGLKEINLEPDKWKFIDTIDGVFYFAKEHADGAIQCHPVKPRYHVDEVVYIKEAYLVLDVNLKDIGDNAPYIRVKVQYKDGEIQWKYMPKDNKTKFTVPDKWHSPLFMPAWAARDFIKITDDRPERLQEITEEDCIREGCPSALITLATVPMVEWYKHLWDSINPKYPFSSNSFVWRYEFIKANGEH